MQTAITNPASRQKPILRQRPSPLQEIGREPETEKPPEPPTAPAV
ncbi:hypothetical protein HMPREF3039_01468 [Akkermansia sp. KLE1798]|nr:hypothetical protein HMPREF3039_01468 [Akkermansia sp. KLE1798]